MARVDDHVIPTCMGGSPDTQMVGEGTAQAQPRLRHHQGATTRPPRKRHVIGQRVAFVIITSKSVNTCDSWGPVQRGGRGSVRNVPDLRWPRRHADPRATRNTGRRRPEGLGPAISFVAAPRLTAADGWRRSVAASRETGPCPVRDGPESRSPTRVDKIFLESYLGPDALFAYPAKLS